MSDRIFKGATRPPLVLGVPLVPMVLVSMGAFLGILWGLMLSGGFAALVVAVAASFAILAMRYATKQDDQRLRQLGLRARLRVRSLVSGNDKYWAGTATSPFEYRR